MNSKSPYEIVREIKEFLNQQNDIVKREKNHQGEQQQFELASLYRTIEGKINNFINELEFRETGIPFSVSPFSIDEYAKTKEEVVIKIKETHKWDTIEGFIADGVICPEIYEKQEVRFLALLAESYGYSDHGLIDIEDQPEDDVLGVGDVKRQTPRKIATLLWLVFQSLDNKKELSWEEFPNLLEGSTENYHKLQDTLSRIAYVNVKKASRPIEAFGNNATRLDPGEIYSSGCKNKDILRLQIQSIRPHFIIVCSDPVWDCVYDNDLAGEEIEEKKWTVQVNELGQRVIHVSHPNYLVDWSYESIYETYKIIYNSLINLS